MFAACRWFRAWSGASPAAGRGALSSSRLSLPSLSWQAGTVAMRQRDGYILPFNLLGLQLAWGW